MVRNIVAHASGALRRLRVQSAVMVPIGPIVIQDAQGGGAATGFAQGWDFSGLGSLFASHVWMKLAVTVLVLLGVWLVRRVVNRVVHSKVDDRALQYRWGKAIGYVTWVISILLVATIWVDGLRQLGTFLGLFSAGVAIALKDVIVDVAGWVVILTKPPLALGDRVQIGKHAGDVVDISVLHLTLLEIGNWVEADQSTGRVVRIPNAKILTEPIANYTAEFPYLWNEIPVVVTFESDWRRAKELFMASVREITEETSKQASKSLRRRPSRMLISYGTVTATVYTSVLDHGVCLTLRFLTEPRRRRGVQQALWEAILTIIDDEPDIELAYPTARIVNDGQPSLPNPFLDGD